MEEILLRFSHLGQIIFESLTNQDLAQSREISQFCKDFIEHEKIFLKRRIQTFFIKLPISFEKAFKKSTVEQVQEMASNIQKFEEMWNSEMSPLHDAAVMGKISMFLELFDPTNIDNTRGEKLAPLQMAAGKGYLAICKLIRNNENNYFKNMFRFAKGITPADVQFCSKLRFIFCEFFRSGNVWFLAVLGQNPKAKYCCIGYQFHIKEVCSAYHA